MSAMNLSDWDDFEIIQSSQNSSGASLYESYKSLKSHFENLPKKELIDRGWISSNSDISSLTDLFKEINYNSATPLFRKSGTANQSLSSLWLSKVKSYAKAKVITENIPPFSELSLNYLNQLARMSVDVQVLKQIPEILSQKGIVVVYCRSLPGMKVDGAVFRLPSGNPVIGMSLRYPRLDSFWFTLMHELAHIVLHLDILDNPILDDLETDSNSDIEIAANHLAKYSFVERRAWRNCEPKYNKSTDAIVRFAESAGIHRSIVAGLLRKESGNYASYSKLVNEHDVREIILNGY